MRNGTLTRIASERSGYHILRERIQSGGGSMPGPFVGQVFQPARASSQGVVPLYFHRPAIGSDRKTRGRKMAAESPHNRRATTALIRAYLCQFVGRRRNNFQLRMPRIDTNDAVLGSGPRRGRDRSSPANRETCGRGEWPGPPLLAAVPRTGHNESNPQRPWNAQTATFRDHCIK
jgi:hypothetical protein